MASLWWCFGCCGNEKAAVDRDSTGSHHRKPCHVRKQCSEHKDSRESLTNISFTAQENEINNLISRLQVRFDYDEVVIRCAYGNEYYIVPDPEHNNQLVISPNYSDLCKFVHLAFVFNNRTTNIFINRTTGPMCVQNGHLATGIKSSYYDVNDPDLQWLIRIIENKDTNYYFYIEDLTVRELYHRDEDDKKQYVCTIPSVGEPIKLGTSCRAAALTIEQHDDTS